MVMTGMLCEECGTSVEVETHEGDGVWTAFCSPEHCAKWQSERSEEDIIRHQFGDQMPWAQYDRCQWCKATLKSGYHEDWCVVRDVMEHNQ